MPKVNQVSKLSLDPIKCDLMSESSLTLPRQNQELNIHFEQDEEEDDGSEERRTERLSNYRLEFEKSEASRSMGQSSNQEMAKSKESMSITDQPQMPLFEFKIDERMEELDFEHI